MNAFLLSILALVSGADFLELPIYRTSAPETVAAKDGTNSISFNREVFYANISVDGRSYKTHLEPRTGDVVVYEGIIEQNCNPPQSIQNSLDNLGQGEERGFYYLEKVEFEQAKFTMPFGIMKKTASLDGSYVGELGLAPHKYPTYSFPMANQEYRNGYIHFADGIKNYGYAKSDAFTINLAPDASGEDKLVYGAMDLSRFTGKLKAQNTSPFSFAHESEFIMNGHKSKAAKFWIEEANTYLDDEVAGAVASTFGAKFVPELGLFRASTMPQDDLVLNFDGVEIRVPPADVWVQDKQGDGQWYFTVRPRTAFREQVDTIILGGDVLKSVYIVYDLGHDRVAFGQAVRNPGPANYEVIPAEGIPKRFLA